MIRAEIRRRGRITFHRFMELCLFHPQLGYYNSGKVRLGKAGDFYTSAHTAPVFARILARHWERLWNRLGQPSCWELIELGPGDGLFASELLSFIRRRFPKMFESLRYIGMEQSSALRGVTSEALRPFADRVRIAADWDDFASSTASVRCVFANEFFDALPIHLMVWRHGAWKERYVCLESENLAWCEDQPSSPDLAIEAAPRFAPELPAAEREDGSVAEIRPEAKVWMERICQWLLRSAGGSELLVIDYGYTAAELQQGRFPQGSALAYRRHQVIDDLLANTGDQDLTAHVNFSALIEIGERAGLHVRRFESQAKFLMQLGEQDQFSDLFADCASEPDRIHRAQLLKTLILPQGMGEAFRVLAMQTRQ